MRKIATEYTSNLKLPMMTYEDYFDYNIINSAMRIIDEAVSKSVAGKAAHNILDNSNFTNPVNQRGATSYSGTAYGIDRWYGRAAAMTTQVRSADVTITATGTSFVGLKQKIENIADYAGKTVTFAVNLYCSVLPQIAFQDASGTAIASKVGTAKENQTICVSAQVPADATPDNFVPTILVRTSAAGDYAMLYWAALYEGAYTVETLPAYVEKGYAAELAECQRYYIRYGSKNNAPLFVGASNGNNVYVTIPLPTQLRGANAPTLQHSNIDIYPFTVGGAVAVNSISLSLADGTRNMVHLTAAHASGGVAAKTPASLRINAGGYIAINMDL